jgi:uncharacterized protein YbjT (DUF2867 family)
MAKPILVTGAAGGRQGSTGNRILHLLIERGFTVRALVHKIDERSERLEKLDVEVLSGDLLNLNSVSQALRDVKRAYFTYPVDDGLLEATATFAAAARDAGTEMVVNMSQLQSTAVAPSFRNLQHRLADQIFDWANVGALHLNAPPFYENVRALIARTVTDHDAIYLPWGKGQARFPLIAAEDVSRGAAALLTAGDLPAQTRYSLVGQVPTVTEIVETLSRVLNRPIRYVEITDDQWMKAMEQHINRHALEHLANLWRFFRTSGIQKGEQGFEVSAVIEQLTGQRPQTLEEFFRLNAQSFGGIQQPA